MQATNKKLTSEQKAFVREFLIDLNGTEAVIRSGIYAEEARTASSQLLRMPEVAASITEDLVRRAQRTASPTRMLKNMIAGDVSVRRGLAYIAQVMAARAGFAVQRLPPVKRGAAKSAPKNRPARTFHAHLKGKCFYCRGDGPIAQRILRRGEWHSHLKAILHRICAKRQEGTIVEIGANIGPTFLPECAALPQFKFVLIEPLPTFFELLKKNVASLEATNVVLYNVDVSDARVGDIVIIYDDVSGGVAAASSFLGHQNVTIVRSVCLDEMFPDETVALVKADVDGYELDVFRGGPDLIRRSEPDIVFEFNPLAIEVRGPSPLDLPRFLANAGIDTFDLYTEDGSVIETTTDPARIYEVFRARRKPLGYLDVHAYPGA